MESVEELDNKDMILLIRKFKRFFNKNINTRKGEGNNKKGSKYYVSNVESLDILK